jgi:D-alanyl-D-alanine carboxypeptidase (penicillin-binding protein 5/6)
VRRPGPRRLQGPRRLRPAAAGVAALALAALLAPAPAPARAAGAEPQPAARAWALVDARDGELLAAHRPRASYPIASTTKLMTAYVARRALDLDQVVRAPPYVPSSAAESLLGLVAGERIEVRDLLYGLILASGNDAAEALAEVAAGSEGAFVRRMNRAARRLDLDDTSYANPIGLDEPGNYSSAADLTELTLKLRRDEFFRRVFDTPQATLSSGARTRTVVNRNNLVRTVPFVSGVKTGYTLGAGNVLVASAERDGVELVSAVLGAGTESERDAATLELLEYGFSLYRREDVLERGRRLTSVPVRFRDQRLALAPVRDLRLTVRRGERIETAIDAPAEVEGPIDRGQRLGLATVTIDGEPAARVPLAAARPVAPPSLVERVDGAIPGPRPLAWVAAVAVLAALFVGAVALHDRRAG